jgi:hypothetical protein
MIHHSRLAQRGMTLIGAMVGLVVSMLIVMTLMSAYRSVVRLTMESNADAQQSGDLAAAFLFTHLNLSDAGRGLTNPTRADDLLLCENGELVGEALTGCDPEVSGTGSGNAIFWRWGDPDDENAFFCAGLLGSANGQLDYLGPRNCGGTDFPLDGWNEDDVIAIIQPTPTSPPIDFLVEDLGPCDESVCCRPLGVTADSVIQGRIQVTIRSRHVGSNTDLESTTCLVSLPQ